MVSMTTTPTPMVHLTKDGHPGPEHRDPEGNCWWGDKGGLRGGQFGSPCWFYGKNPADSHDICWAPHDAMPLPAARPIDDEDDAGDDRDHPSLSAAERNPGLRARMGA